MAILDLSGPKATEPQIKYIECLAIDLQFDRQQRNAHVADLVGRPIKYLDELSKSEASKVIERFKAWKEGEDAI